MLNNWGYKEHKALAMLSLQHQTSCTFSTHSLYLCTLQRQGRGSMACLMFSHLDTSADVLPETQLCSSCLTAWYKPSAANTLALLLCCECYCCADSSYSVLRLTPSRDAINLPDASLLRFLGTTLSQVTGTCSPSPVQTDGPRLLQPSVQHIQHWEDY